MLSATYNYAMMGAKGLRLALLALVAILICSVYAQETEKSAVKIDVGSLSTQEIEEQLQVYRLIQLTTRHLLNRMCSHALLSSN